MSRRRGTRPRTIPLLFPLLALLGMLAVPVECSLVHGAHSLFVPATALAVVGQAAPGPDHTGPGHAAGSQRGAPPVTLPALTVDPVASAGVALSAPSGQLPPIVGWPVAAEDEPATSPVPRLVDVLETTTPGGINVQLQSLTTLLIGPLAQPVWPALADAWAGHLLRPVTPPPR